MKIAVVTVSDSVFRGVREDRSGPAAAAVFAEAFPQADIHRETVPDEREALLEAFGRLAGRDWILTTGGTGPSPRDVTPETTRAFIDRELPGIAEYLRTESMKETPFAVFSRGIAGMKGRCLIVNVPGSEKAARLCARLLLPLLEHGRAMASGEGH